MVSKVHARYVPVSPRKVRLVARLIRGMDVPQAEALLTNLPKGAARPLGKALKSALANATRAGTWTEEQLFVSKIMTDGGPSAKRHRAAPMGRASVIKKRFSHITIELDARR